MFHSALVAFRHFIGKPPTCFGKNIVPHFKIALLLIFKHSVFVSKCCFLYEGNHCGLQ